VTRRGGREGGADSPNRTDDLPLTRRLLYLLSYAGNDMGTRSAGAMDSGIAWIAIPDPAAGRDAGGAF
jgi:hypothetical protein